MALTYKDSAALMTDADFRGRIKVAGLHFADYIMNEAGTFPAHNSRMKWAQSMMATPEQVAYQIQPPVVMDAAVQDAGAAITDEALQGSVETVVNKLL